MYRAVCLFTPQFLPVLTALTHGGMAWAELTALAGSVLRWFTSATMVTHPGTNWAWRRVEYYVDQDQCITTNSNCYKLRPLLHWLLAYADYVP